MPKFRVLAAALLTLAVLALVLASAAVAQTEYPCAFKGQVFIDDSPVPAGTAVRAKIGGVVVGETTTGLWELADNEYYMDGVMGVPGLEVTFEVWRSTWLPADETAIHVMYGLVKVDLHAWTVATPTPTLTPIPTPTVSPTPTPTGTPSPTPTPTPTPTATAMPTVTPSPTPTPTPTATPTPTPTVTPTPAAGGGLGPGAWAGIGIGGFLVILAAGWLVLRARF